MPELVFTFIAGVGCGLLWTLLMIVILYFLERRSKKREH